MLEALAAVLEAAAAKAREIATDCHANRADWIDQHSSPLGPRRHCAAVRKRVQSGDEGAAIVGRRLLLSHEALAAELARIGKPSQKKKRSIADELREELNLPRR